MFTVFQVIFNLSMLATTLYGVFNIKKIKGAYRWIVFQLIVTSIGELLALYTLKVLGKVAYPVYHVLNPIEYLLFACFFYALTNSFLFKRFILISILVLMVFSLANTIWLQPFSGDNSQAYLSGAMLMVAYSLVYYYELYQREDYDLSIVRIPSFWIVTGVFFLYTGSFFVIGFRKILLVLDPETVPNLYIINLFLNISLFAFTFYGLRWARNRT